VQELYARPENGFEERLKVLWRHARRFTPAGFSLLIIFFATFGMFSDPLGDSLFGSEALDYFRLTIRPKNVYHPAESGVFPRHESGPMLRHLPNMRLRRAGFKPRRTFNG
jgi:hypothetical protein